MGIVKRVLNLFRRAWLNREIEAELAAHLELRTEHNLERGMSPDAARRDALLRFGNRTAIRERVLGESAALMLAGLGRDLRHAARQLGRNRGFTAAAVLTLALGVGSVTAIFSVAYAVLVDPFPYRDVATLATPKLCAPEHPQCLWSGYTPEQFLAIERGTDIFSGVAASEFEDMTVTGAGEPERLRGNYTTPNAFAVLGVAPVLGRVPTEADADLSRGGVVLLSYRYWRAHLGGRPSVLGSTLKVNGQARTIIGVMPPRFLFRGSDLYLPIRMTASKTVAGESYFVLIGRLKPGVTEAQAHGELQPIFDEFAHADPRAFAPRTRVGLMPFKQMFASGLEPTLYLLLGAVLALLLIACVNVASLLLARAVEREHEFAVRAALGASRVRLLRFALAEAVLLALAALPLAFGLAYAGLAAILRLVPADTIPDEALVTLNLPVLAASAALALLTVAAAGLLPAWHGARQQPASAIKQVRSSQGRGQRRALQGLVVAEMALCLGLLGLAGLMMRSLLAVESRPLPYSPEHTFALWAAPDRVRYSTAAQRSAYMQALVERIRALPGVQTASIDDGVPVYGAQASEVAVDGRDNKSNNIALLHAADASFRTITSQVLIEGRFLTEADAANRVHNTVVSEYFVKRFFDGKSSLGRSFHLPELLANNDERTRVTPEENRFTVVGVRRDLPDTLGFTDKPLPEVDLPYTLSGYADVILASTTLPAAQLIAPARKAVYALDPLQTIRIDDTYQHLLEQYGYASPRFAFALFGAFAASALLLTLTGIHGVFSFTTSQRTREFGIRLALGSPRAEVARLVLLGGAKLLAAGVALGVPLALVAGHWAAARDQLAFVSQHDAPALAGALVMLLLFTLAGIVLPALRAARVDPVTALRSE